MCELHDAIASLVLTGDLTFHWMSWNACVHGL